MWCNVQWASGDNIPYFLDILDVFFQLLKHCATFSEIFWLNSKMTPMVLFQHPLRFIRQSSFKLKVQHFKRHAELYGQAFLVLDSRRGDLEKFLQHESSPYPPALSSEGSLNSCTKSDLLIYIMQASESSASSVDEELTCARCLRLHYHW